MAQAQAATVIWKVGEQERDKFNFTATCGIQMTVADSQDLLEYCDAI